MLAVKKTLYHFLAAYTETAAAGQSDALGSIECERVFQEWRKAGRPADILAFIREAANRPAPIAARPEQLQARQEGSNGR
jgi:hypothetical protein